MNTGVRGGPRFDLLFEGGECVVRAQGPLPAGAARLERLSMNAEIRGSFDLRGGSDRVRNRRTRLGEVVARLSFAALAEHSRSRGVSIRFEPIGPDVLRIEAEDAAGIVCLEGRVGVRGADLLLVPCDLRWFRAGPRSAWSRVTDIARQLQIPFQIGVGAFVAERPLRRCLAQALLPRGWRVPDDRSVHLALTLERDSLVLRSGDASSPGTLLEEGRAFAAALDDEVKVDWVRKATTPAIAPLLPRHGAGEAELRQRLARETSRWLQADGVLAAAERLHDADRLTSDWERLVLDALGVFPGDLTRHRDWALRWAGEQNPNAIELLKGALSGPWSRISRAGFIADVLLTLVESEPEQEAELFDELLALAERARRDAPELASTSAAMGALFAWCGSAEPATECFVRAADLETDRSRVATWRRRAAEQALESHGAAAAERMLEQAMVESDGDPLVIVALARIVAQRGDNERADELLGRLLRAGMGGGTHEDALVAAARFHVERGESDRAHPFLARLGPSLSPPVDRDFDQFDEDPSFSDEDGFESAEIHVAADFDFADGASRMDNSRIDDALIDEAFPSQIFERPELEATGVVQDERPRPTLAPSSDDVSVPFELHAMSDSRSDAPQVTMVATTDDSLRALLDEVRESDDPEALLDGALEGAIESGDESTVLDVVRVLDRIENLRGEERLRRRIQRWRDKRADPDKPK